MTLAERLKSLRRKAGLTQFQLAVSGGFFPSQISSWERGVYPDLGHLPDLCKPLGVEVHEFLRPVRLSPPAARRQQRAA